MGWGGGGGHVHHETPVEKTRATLLQCSNNLLAIISVLVLMKLQIYILSIFFESSLLTNTQTMVVDVCS